MHQQGLLITLEGTEGVGKSTALRFLKAHLEGKDQDVVVTREPGGTPLAEEIRQVLLHRDIETLTDEAELLLLFAGRAQHIHHVIQPALEAGRVVLCDRFIDATYAYQCGGRELPSAWVETLEKMILKGLKPDCTILLDAPVQLGMSRVEQRGDKDRFEQERVEFFERVRRCYLQRAANEPKRFKIIDASQSLEQVQQALREAF